jgi:metallo-beta-lactamase class B
MSWKAAIGGMVGALVCATATPAQTPPAWERPTAPFRIGDNLYYVGTEGIAAYLITTPKGHILIDGAMPTSAKPIEASIVKLGFKVRDVRLLLNTHAHFDHTGGLAELKRDTGARFIASAGDRAALETGKYVGWEDNRAFDFAPVKVDAVLVDGDKVRMGGMTLTANITPGHTAGCTTWTFPVKVDGAPRQAMIYCSTTVAANRLASKTRGPQYPGIVEAYRGSFARLKTMKADVFLAPHPEQFGLAEKLAKRAKGAPSPFVDPGELGRVVAASEIEFERELTRQQEAAK